MSRGGARSNSGPKRKEKTTTVISFRVLSKRAKELKSKIKQIIENEQNHSRPKQESTS